MKRSYLVALVLITGCATSRPVLYPNAYLDHVGPAVADRDIASCARAADANVSSTRGTETVRNTTVAGGVGAASGAVGGTIYGAPGTGAAIGAASGATAGLLGSLFTARTPSPTYQNYITACLGERGYRVIGWE